MMQHNWVSGVREYHCAAYHTLLGRLTKYNRSYVDCAGCGSIVESRELAKWSPLLPRELNAALDRILAVRQQVAEEVVV